MNKKFCDICEAPAPDQRKNNKHIVLERNVLCDQTARIVGNFGLSFTHHTSGYGGPPDVCDECFNILINQYKNEIFNEKIEDND